MTAQRGSLLTLARGDGATPTEAFTDVGGLRSGTLTLNGNPINVTSADDVDVNNEIWNTYITGPKDLSYTGELIVKATNATQSRAIYNAFATGAIENYEIDVPLIGVWTVALIVTDFSPTGNYDDVITFSITFNAASAPTFVAAS